MKPLFEQFRPALWSDVIGQDKVISRIENLRRRSRLSGRAYWISGQSGTGKTTIARLLAADIADPFMIDEVDAETLTPSQLQAWERSSALCGWGKGGRVFIINEAHGLKKTVIRQLLVTLERIPSHVAWIFTTTRDGQDNLFDENMDAHPLLSRCQDLALTTQGLAKSFAARVAAIADSEGLNGRPIEDYVKLAKRCRNNMRAMLQEVELGVMLPN